jgi:serine/threonine protein kinase
VTTPHRDFFGPVGPDYGGLHFDTMRFWTAHWYRVPYVNEAGWYEEERYSFLKRIDEDSEYEDHWEEMTEVDRANNCHRMKWVDTQHQTCNLFHELHLGREPLTGHHHHHSKDPLDGVDVTQSYHRRYLSHGYFRDSWLWEPVYSRTRSTTAGGANHSTRSPPVTSPLGLENFVLKALRLNNPALDYSWGTAHNMFKEALVMERTTASRRTMNAYGHCYTSLLVEQGFEISQRIVQGVEYHGRGRVKQEDLDKLQSNGTLVSFNEFSAEEKLEVATAMAEAIAMMHGHEEGVIVNDDVHPDQFLVNKHGEVKFNDMNNAHLLDWNPANNSYCKWHIWIGGDYRSPEEMRAEPIDEKSDVWPMGALIFGLLTGLFPYYTEWDASTIEKIIASGEPPYLDPRWSHKSYIEGRMVEIMEKCFTNLPEDRASIFDVVLHLRVTAGFAEVLRQQGKVDWSTKPAGLVPEVSIPSPEYEMYGASNNDDDGGDSSNSGDDRYDDHQSSSETSSHVEAGAESNSAGSGGTNAAADLQRPNEGGLEAKDGASLLLQDDKPRGEGVRGRRDDAVHEEESSPDDHLGEEQ